MTSLRVFTVFIIVQGLVCQAPNLSGISFVMDEDNPEVSGILSPNLLTLSSKSLAQFLQTQRFTPSQCKVLEANQVDGKMFLEITRADLMELFPDDFPTRKRLWDFRCSMISPMSSVLEDGADQTFHFSPTRSSTPNSTMSTLSPYSSMDEDILSQSQSHTDNSIPYPLKRTRSRQYPQVPHKKEREKLLGDDFKIPISDAVKKSIADNSILDDASRRQLIRDSVTCLKAYAGKHLSSEHFTEAAKVLCKEVPVLQDEKPPLWPEDVDFEYWSSTKRLLKKRYSNEKSSSKKSVAEPEGDYLNMGTEEDIEKHEKQLRKELDAKKKGAINWKAVEQLQGLTFTSRFEKIASISGHNAVATMLEQFPYFEHEKVLLRELELHISKLTKTKCSYETFMERWSTLSKCFQTEEEDNGESFAALCALKSIHEPFDAQPPLLSLREGEKMEQFLNKRVPSTLPYLLFSMTEEPFTKENLGAAQVFVIVDKGILCECTSQAKQSVFKSCLITLLAVFYAFNLHYGDTEKNMYKFLEEHILGIIPKRKSYILKQIENKLFKSFPK